MNIKSRKLFTSVCALALVANSGVIAQDKKGDGKDVSVQRGLTDSVTVNTSTQNDGAHRVPEVNYFVAAAQQGGDSAFQFFSQEMSFDNRLVKGAPFSADIVSETIQTLPDGNRIIQRFESRIYRDSQGRTRNDRTFQMGGSSDQKQTITIYDPVGGASYNLDPETRIARKTPSYVRVAPTLIPPTPPTYALSTGNADTPRKISVSGSVLQGSAIKKVQPPYPPIAKAAKASGAVQIQVTISETGEVIDATVISGHPLLRDAGLQAARQWVFKPTELSGVPVKVQGILTFNFTLNDEVPAPASYAKSIQKTVIIPKQMLEGVECEGTRIITTIPAGVIGNERPIETIYETWYSDDLKMMIQSRRSDPRFGETTYRVTNISRSEPDASVFQIPSEYTLMEGGPGKIEIGGKEGDDTRKRSEGTRKPNDQ